MTTLSPLPSRMIPNLSSNETTVCTIDELCARPPLTANTKDELIKLGQRRSTTHAFYSGFTGVNATMRTSEKTNPPVELHWLIADFDADMTGIDVEEQMLTNLDTRLCPSALTSTFSNHARVIWALEKPVILEHKKFRQSFMQVAASELRLSKLLPGWDEGAWRDCCKYYELGSRWALSGSTIAPETIQSWLFEASKKLDRVGLAGETLPIDQIATLVERDFPGRWVGDFVLNARGCRFWNADSDNMTGTVVKEDGMICFTGDKTFIPWVEIFGREALSECQANRIHSATSDIWFDGKLYWRKLPKTDHWEDAARQDIQLWMRHIGLSSESINGHPSEVDESLIYVQSNNRITGAFPLPYHTKGFCVLQDGSYVLNTTRVSILEPADPCDDIEDRMPWLSEFLADFFVSEEQLMVFFTWLKRFYETSRAENPTQGQSLFIAGPAGAGKTLIANRIIGALMGGFCDATDAVMGDNNFNAHVMRSGVWCVDDGEITKRGGHQAYSLFLKRMSANTNFNYNEKFQKGGTIPWKGRVVVTCNLDSESLRVLPNMEASILDKVILLKSEGSTFKFKNPWDTEQAIARELPYFARWLLDWVPSEEHAVGGRYGVKAFQDADLLDITEENSPTSAFEEALVVWLTAWSKSTAGKGSEFWEGTTLELFSGMTEENCVLSRAVTRDWTVAGVGRMLAKMGKKSNCCISKIRTSNRRIIRIDLKKLIG